MNDDMDWRDGSVPRTLPEGVGMDWSRGRSHGRRRAPRHVPVVPFVIIVVIAGGFLFWLGNRGAVQLAFLSVHVTAPLWVVASAHLAAGLVLGAWLLARLRR